jgi:hypothetical protein
MPDHPFPVDSNDPAALHRARYWRVVTRTVRDVFGAGAETVAQVDEVRRRLAGQPEGTQEKFYQTEPYSVAADIAGEAGAGTERQQLDYLRIRQTEDYAPVDPDRLTAVI